MFGLFLIARNAASSHEDRSDDVSSKMQEMRRSNIVGGVTLEATFVRVVPESKLPQNEPHIRINDICSAIKVRAGFESAFSGMYSSSKQIANR